LSWIRIASSILDLQLVRPRKVAGRIPDLCSPALVFRAAPESSAWCARSCYLALTRPANTKSCAAYFVPSTMSPSPPPTMKPPQERALIAGPGGVALSVSDILIRAIAILRLA
jgi:hypothetical protein